MYKSICFLTLGTILLYVTACNTSKEPKPQITPKPVLIEQTIGGSSKRTQLNYHENNQVKEIVTKTTDNGEVTEHRVYRFFYNLEGKVKQMATGNYTETGAVSFFRQSLFNWENGRLTSIQHSNGKTDYFTYNYPGQIIEVLQVDDTKGPFRRMTYKYEVGGNFTEETTYYFKDGIEKLWSKSSYGDFDQSTNVYALVPEYQYINIRPFLKNNARLLSYFLDSNQNGALEEDEEITSTFQYIYDEQGLPTKWKHFDRSFVTSFTVAYQD